MNGKFNIVFILIVIDIQMLKLSLNFIFMCFNWSVYYI